MRLVVIECDRDLYFFFGHPFTHQLAAQAWICAGDSRFTRRRVVPGTRREARHPLNGRPRYYYCRSSGLFSYASGYLAPCFDFGPTCVVPHGRVRPSGHGGRLFEDFQAEKHRPSSANQTHRTSSDRILVCVSIGAVPGRFGQYCGINGDLICP